MARVEQGDSCNLVQQDAALIIKGIARNKMFGGIIEEAKQLNSNNTQHNESHKDTWDIENLGKKQKKEEEERRKEEDKRRKKQ